LGEAFLRVTGFVYDGEEKEGKKEEEEKVIFSTRFCRGKIPLDGGIFFVLKT